MSEILTIDIGGTKTNICLVKDLKIIDSEIFLTQSSPEHFIQKINSICNEKKYKYDGLSLSLPGEWDRNGVLKESFFLQNWINYPFVDKLKTSLGVKDCIWETDVICGALGEYNTLVGACRSKPLLYINLGTGIGAALIKDGKPYKSNSNLTLRLQKMVCPIDDQLFPASDLICGGGLIKNTKYKSIEELFNDYKKANVEAYEIITKSQIQLAACLINLFYLFAPGVIVLNGGLTYDWEVIAEEAINIANEELENKIEIIPGKLKEKAPIIGAYLNFMRHCEGFSLKQSRLNLCK